MGREDILHALYNNKMSSGCSMENCKNAENELWTVACKKCAEKELVEYEQKVRAGAVEEFASEVKKEYPLMYNDFGMEFNNNIHHSVDKISKKLKERQTKGIKICSTGDPCRHPNCPKCGTTHFISECNQ